MNRTEDDNNLLIDGAVFITRKLSPEMQERTDSMRKAADELERKASVSPVLRIIKFLAFIGAFLCLGLMIRAEGTVFEGFRYSIAFYPTFLASLLIWIGLSYFEAKKGHQIAESRESVDFEDKGNALFSEIRSDLGWPEDAPSIDILCRFYKIKNDKMINIHRMTDYVNRPFYIYREGENVNFATIENVVSIPVSSIGNISKINLKVKISSWNKEEAPASEKYKPYQIGEVNGILLVAPHYCIDVERDGEIYEIRIPCYDMDTFMDCAGLKITKTEAIEK